MPPGVLSLDTVDILTGVSLDKWSKGFDIFDLIFLILHPMDALQHFHQQLQAAYFAYVAGNLSAVHPLFAGL
jgi:hypothetical protein